MAQRMASYRVVVMSRAVAVFLVTHGDVAIRVRVLATVAQVDAAYREGAPRRASDDVVHAFCETRPRARHTIVLPADGDLAELVPHEVVHAVVSERVFVGEEALATAVGCLSGAIFRQLAQRGIEVRPCAAS